MHRICPNLLKPFALTSRLEGKTARAPRCPDHRLQSQVVVLDASQVSLGSAFGARMDEQQGMMV